ncbi:hypothetical protein CDAR_309371 [Caerostris darwini]|uniref:Uncharacterized protein n=1 Tax=Caerostris darwini TaxID=1538125 RepID=A0AAV4SFW7_9ARAC|nr:hypothetical protein CDAR_309371 [Caerostris darwini]
MQERAFDILQSTSVRYRNLIKIKTERSDIPEATAALGMPPPSHTVASSGVEVATTGVGLEVATTAVGLEVATIGPTLKIK